MFKYACTFLLVTLHIVGIGQVIFPEKGYVFDDTVVPEVRIIIDMDSLNALLHPANQESNHEYPATFIFKKENQLDTVENVGFRLRGNTSRNAEKKSFKVSFNSFKKGKDFYNLEKMNLNGEHNDPSIMRAKLCWDLYREAGIPGSRSNHVAFYINDEYRGLYLNVEHVDEEFVQKHFENNQGNLYKCLWPADMHYRGANPDLYKVAEPWGRQAYELKTNLDVNNYVDIARFIDILNNYSGEEFICSLEEVFDVDNYLRVIAMDILTSNWDGPIVNKNNFYLYSDPCTGIIHYLPYDLDNTFGIDWFSIDWPNTSIYNWSDLSGQYRPLYESIMGVEIYRDKFSRYMEEFITQLFNNDLLDPMLDDFRSKLLPFRVNDIFAQLDYDYSVDDFNNSFSDFNEDHVPYGLKSYISKRVTNAMSQLDIKEVSPTLEAQEIDWQESSIDFQFQVQEHGVETYDVTFHYLINQGNEMTVPLTAIGKTFTHTHVVIEEGNLDYYINITSSNGLSSRYPSCDYYTQRLGYRARPPLVINEFMASNLTTYPDNQGLHHDWIEIYNDGESGVPLWNRYLTDDPSDPNKWELPHIVLASKEYIVFFADSKEDNGSLHTNFKLDKDGEFIGLYDGKSNNYAALDSITYGAQETDISSARIPNGSGPFVTAPFNTPGGHNEQMLNTDDPNNRHWKIYPNPTRGTLVISEFKGEVNIQDAKGIEVFKVHSDGTIDLTALTQGVYFIKLQSGGKSSTQKIIKL